jgi:S1-C subfamily serine protease
MGKKYWAVTGVLGCMTMVLLLAVIVIPVFVVPWQIRSALSATTSSQTLPQPTPTPGRVSLPAEAVEVGTSGTLQALYEQSNPGIVSIVVSGVRRGALRGRGAGSGFIIDEQGHIVTNNHVVAGATQVTVIFYDGHEATATIVGTDPSSDLAVIKVKQLPEGTHPLPLGDSDQVAVGEMVVAIGNPFGLGNSMTVGFVSALGRTIDSGATQFSIPRAIQTDAAINPGNSGGPLLNLKGEVIGVNAQIATEGVAANAGVGFAIPVNTVRQVVPALVESGSYSWPWLGISGTSVNLLLMQANDLDTQRGAYVDDVISNGPAAEAGMRGSSGTRKIDGIEVPVGGDVIVAVDGTPIASFDDLLVEIAARQPGDRVELTIIRNGQRQELTVTLAARPASL